jgi:hypothetical protein
VQAAQIVNFPGNATLSSEARLPGKPVRHPAQWELPVPHHSQEQHADADDGEDAGPQLSHADDIGVALNERRGFLILPLSFPLCPWDFSG